MMKYVCCWHLLLQAVSYNAEVLRKGLRKMPSRCPMKILRPLSVATFKK
jgi:hypothetical protein